MTYRLSNKRRMEKGTHKVIAITAWCLWFAWYPVYVDAYSPDEIKNGHTRYRVWLQTVEYSRHVFVNVDDEDQIVHDVWRYRLPRIND